MKLKRLYRELVRRNVFRAVLAYLAVAWVLIEFSSVVLPTFDAPSYILPGLIYLLAIGLFFWSIFAWLYDLTPEGWKKTPDWTDTTEIRAANSRRLNAVIAVAGVTAILLLLAGSFWAGSNWEKGQDIRYEPRYQIAVIPFQADTTELEDAEVFQSSLTQELIQALSENRSLSVLNMGSSRYFTAGLVPENTYLASQSENIDYFVWGKLLKKDKLIEVTLELRKQLAMDPIWTRRYQSDLSEVKQLWASATSDLLEYIGLGTRQKVSIRRELRSINPETYELYLKGKYYLNKSTVEDWKQGLVYLQEAIDRNPADADAWASLAEGYITWGHSLMPPDDVFPKALAAAKRAIELDSVNAEGWAALAHYHAYFGWDWDMAEYAFQKADSLNPNMSWNHYHHSWFLALLGKVDKAIKEHERAQELDPFTPATTTDLAELYRWVGEYELGLKELQKIYEMSSGNNTRAMIFKGLILEDQGKIEEGLEIMRQACEINPGWNIFYGPALVRNNRMQDARGILAMLESRPPTPFFSLIQAWMYHEMGDLDKTFEYLEKGKRHAWYPGFVRIYLGDETMQQDPRYPELIRELNLPPPGPFEYTSGS